MKLGKIAAAYAALTRLCAAEWEFQTAYALLTLRRALSPHAAFFAEKEAEIARQYGKKEADGRVHCDGEGRFSLAEDADPQAYREKMLSLAAVEIMPDWQPVTLRCAGTISPLTIEALTGFVSFSGGEDA